MFSQVSVILPRRGRNGSGCRVSLVPGPFQRDIPRGVGVWYTKKGIYPEVGYIQGVGYTWGGGRVYLGVGYTHAVGFHPPPVELLWQSVCTLLECFLVLF